MKQKNEFKRFYRLFTKNNKKDFISYAWLKEENYLLNQDPSFKEWFDFYVTYMRSCDAYLLSLDVDDDSEILLL